MLYGVNKLLSTYVLLVPIYFNENKCQPDQKVIAKNVNIWKGM